MCCTRGDCFQKLVHQRGVADMKQRHRRTFPFLNTALLLSVVTLLVGVAACQSAQPARAFDPKDVVSAGNQAIEHGRAMQQLGGRMVSHGEALGDASWVGDGQHWIADGNTLVAIGERTVKLAQSLANNPIKAQEVDINQVRAQGLAVVSDGQALVEHAKVMSELSDLLKRRTDASRDQPLAQDIADAQAEALRMGQTGQQLVTSGQRLVDFVDSLARSIAR
jgi:hypothetical protein